MPFPSKFIANSDYASTPSSLEGGKKIDLTTPANVHVEALEIKKFSQSISFDEPFDTVEYIITCDEFPYVAQYNDMYREDNLTRLYAYIQINGKTITLTALFTDIISGTFPDERHFHAVVVPIKSPYNQS